MLIPYILLLVIWIISFIIFVISLKSEGASADVLQVFLVVSSVIVCITAFIGYIFASKTGKVYRSEYDKIIQSIDSDKTKVFKEDDEITDIYITVNGEEYHFKFKEEENNE